MRKLVLAAIAATAVLSAAILLWHRQPDAPVAVLSDAAKTEAEALRASKGLAWREGESLSLRLKTGEMLTLTNHLTCGDIPCPKMLAVGYRYLGWDATAGGYKLSLDGMEMVLPYAEDPVLLDAHHVAPVAEGPQPLPPMPPKAVRDDTVLDWLSDIATGRDRSEAAHIAASGGKASRDGAKLLMNLEGGRKFVLTDDLQCGQISCPSHVFRIFNYAGGSPDGRFHVVEERFDEVSVAMLVDMRDGVVTSLLSAPKFSPDGKLAATAVTDLEWSSPNRLEVWSFRNAKPELEFVLPAASGDDTVYEVVSWADADHVRLRRSNWGSDQRSDAMLVHAANGWHLESGN